MICHIQDKPCEVHGSSTSMKNPPREPRYANLNMIDREPKYQSETKKLLKEISTILKSRGLEQRTSEPQQTRPTSIDCGASQPPKLSRGLRSSKHLSSSTPKRIYPRWYIYIVPRHPQGGHKANDQNLQASEARLYTFSPETKTALRKFRLGTSRAKDPQAVICKQHTLWTA